LDLKVISAYSAAAILDACKKAVDEKEPILLGLPLMCQPKIFDDRVCLHSLIAAEHDVRSYALDVEKILTKVNHLNFLVSG
jgi:hypothetical protein